MCKKCVSCGTDLSMCIEYGRGKPGFQSLGPDSGQYVCSTACMEKYEGRKNASLDALAASTSPVLEFIPDCGIVFAC